MAVRTLDHRTSLLGLLPHVGFTLEMLKGFPITAPHVPEFEALDAEGMQVLMTELDVIKGQMAAQVLVDLADDKLNHFADLTSQTILTITRGNKEHKLYTHFFGGKTVSEFKRPNLGAQLEAMGGWVESLQKSPHQALNALAPQLLPLVEEAEDAKKAREQAKKRNRVFRDVGERRQWLDRVNAARKELYGALAKLPHLHEGLPTNFADMFFLKESKRADENVAEEEDTSVEGARAKIEELQALLAQAEARLAELLQAEEAEAAAAAARAAEQALLAELDKEAEALERRRAALRARLDTGAAR